MGEIRPALWKEIVEQELKRKIESQKEICKMNKEPLWIEGGECPKCKVNIYDWLTEKECKDYPIHVCPNCDYSFTE